MRYLEDEIKNYYFKKGINFNKNSDKNILKYAVAANLYMNGLTDIHEKILKNKLEGVFTITICFEDSIRESQVEDAQENVLRNLELINRDIKNEILDVKELPLIFIRVRNVRQFIEFSKLLKKEEAKLICGFVYPKFDAGNAKSYLNHTTELSELLGVTFYAMPILESSSIIYKENRIENLIKIKRILNVYEDIILNIRVGGTDFSSKFGLRRSVYTSIYDVKVVCDCLLDIINFFAREENNYVISGPVFEYFSDIYESIEIKSLLREIELDLENGFFGKTAIHPNQIKFIKRSYIVSYENYIDAKNIIDESKIENGGVFNGENRNKMNEVTPHVNWAEKILERAKVFGVLKREFNNKEMLFRGQDFED
ncbi:MAG: HpcH/HpaI aldolase/citrate lyase family protein [Sarcina sp.]